MIILGFRILSGLRRPRVRCVANPTAPPYSSSTVQPSATTRLKHEKAKDGSMKLVEIRYRKGYAEILENCHILLLSMEIPICKPQFLEGEMFFTFSQTEILKFAEPFCFAVVLKFQRHKPSLDQMRGYIKNRWGVKSMPVVGQL